MTDQLRGASQSLWGVGAAGPIHFGYDASALQQLKLIKSGFSHTILLADLHVMMSHGLPYNDAKRRARYYESVFSAGYGIEARFISGSEFQLTPEYQTLLLDLAARTSTSALEAALPLATASAKNKRPLLGSLLYPLMQCLDAVYLGADLVVADEAQRKTYDLLKHHEVWNGMSGLVNHRSGEQGSTIPKEFRYFKLPVDLRGRPLHESSSRTRISIHETNDSLQAKVKAMFAPPGRFELDGKHNALLHYVRHSALPWLGRPVLIQTRDGFWSDDSADSLDLAYSTGELHPNDLKTFLFDVLLERTHQFRSRLATVSYDWIDLSIVRRVQGASR